MILNISSPDFWAQPQLTLTVILGFYLLCIAIALFLLYWARSSFAKAGHSIGAFWRSPSATWTIRILRIVLSLVGLVVFILSVKGSSDAGLGVLALVILWPCVIGQIVAGFLPWERFIRSNSDMAALFIFVLYLAAVLDYTLYSF
ncbi:MAG TPA: hypothetical protein VFB59_05250 [Candidatus Saccharimonadales bacterium]|nr:hypothetical protein [Candidatus Saccharimonadales bacterium]